MLELRLNARRIFIGVTAGILIIAGPSFIILRGVPLLNWQEAVLWLAELLGCVMFFVCVPEIKTKLSSIFVAYSFVFLYCALAILCWKTKMGIIGWHAIENIGVALCIIGIIVLYLFFKHSTTQFAVLPFTRCVFLLGITSTLIGINLICSVWPPVFAIPGAVVLANIFFTETKPFKR